jgi:glycosidase
MFNQFLDKILEGHPLLGLEKEDQNKGHLTGLKAPAWVYLSPIYQIFVRNYSTQGTFNTVRDKIPYLQQLGIKTIWLMPIYPSGKEKRKGSEGSPYAIQDYTSIDSKYGTAKDLKSLIDVVHTAGMKLILDLVVNHMALDSIYRHDNPKYFLQDDKGVFTRKVSEWGDVIDLDYTNQGLRSRIRDIIRYWVEEFDIDGYRCDVAGLVPLDFWEDVYADLIKIKKDIFLLAEWESANLHPRAFHATYDWSTHFVLEDIYRGRRPAEDAITWVIEKEANYPRNALPLRFTENHDLERTREKFGENSFYPFVVFNFILYGLPLIYCGQEIGLIKVPSLFDKDPIDWNQSDKKILGFYKKLIILRQKNPALSSREMIPIGNDNSDRVVTIEKDYKTSKILIILNFSAQQLVINIDIADHYHNIEKFEDLYSGKRMSKTNLRKFEIEPYGFYIFKPICHPCPSIIPAKGEINQLSFPRKRESREVNTSGNQPAVIPAKAGILNKRNKVWLYK